ncbi:6725_t:CDS:2 [Gigaspora margarita]|uniref:6725_t:CDS:1 n=1 Tax=Gigaspora margarita TaxID=4874 RepID=A0ABN7UUE4_GIGMA|nr:6725_t:CDS:2 [Gigaspora margarita]
MYKITISQTIEDTTLTKNGQSPHYNNTTTIQTTPPNITHPVHFILKPSQPLKTITHNIQGLSVNINFQQWLEYCNEQKAHIISITETKWPESTILYILLTNSLYKIYTMKCNAKTAIQGETKSDLISLLDFNDIEEHTWSRNNSSNQIDDIWTSYSILLNVSEPKLLTSDESTKSDHKILSIEWNTGISLKTGRKKQSKRKIYMYNRVTTDDWTKFSDDLIKKMEELQLHSPIIQDKNHLNKYWNKWENLLCTTINKHIPYSYSAPRTFHRPHHKYIKQQLTKNP